MSVFPLYRTRLRPLYVQVKQRYTPMHHFSVPGKARLFSSYIVTPAELDQELGRSTSPTRPSVIPVSAEWFLPNDGRNGYEEFHRLRIPGARFFDLDAIKDPISQYPHMVPTPGVFVEAMKNMGISREDTVGSIPFNSTWCRYFELLRDVSVTGRCL